MSEAVKRERSQPAGLSEHGGFSLRCTELGPRGQLGRGKDQAPFGMWHVWGAFRTSTVVCLVGLGVSWVFRAGTVCVLSEQPVCLRRREQRDRPISPSSAL